MSAEQSIKSFWNRAAEENPYWYVSSYGSYGADRNLEEFWASGNAIWADIKQVTGYTPGPSDTVVEIGCGVGRLTRAIAPQVGRVIALDISDRMLAIARVRRPTPQPISTTVSAGPGVYPVARLMSAQIVFPLAHNSSRFRSAP